MVQADKNLGLTIIDIKLYTKLMDEALQKLNHTYENYTKFESTEKSLNYKKRRAILIDLFLTRNLHMNMIKNILNQDKVKWIFKKK